MKHETMLRSWVKSLVWRLFGFVILGFITYVLTGNWSESLLVSFWFNMIRFVLYFVHERIWLLIKWGIKNDNLDNRK